MAHDNSKSLSKLPIIAVEFDSSERVLGSSEPFMKWCNTVPDGDFYLADVLDSGLYLQLREYIHRSAGGRYAECTVSLAPGKRSENYRVYIAPVLDDDKQNSSVLTALPLGRDIALAEQNRAYEYLRITLDTIDQGVTIYDSDLKLVAWNPVYEKMKIFPPEMIHYGASLKDAYRKIAELGVFGEGDPEELAKTHINAIRTREMAAVEELHPPTGRVIKIHRYYLPCGGICATFTDITEQKRYEEELIRQANTDQLTNVPNRHHALLRLEHACRLKQQFYLLFIDLDRFKLINDTYGHHIGDELLKKTVKILTDTVDVEGGDFIGRIGGDEFVIICNSATKMETVDQICKSILQQFDQPYKVYDHTVFLTGSIGVACFPEHGSSSDELISKADTAMYHSKLLGRNTFQHYSNAIGAKIKKRTMIANQLRRQIKTTNNPLFLEFQPIVELADKRVVAAEALLRWKDIVQHYVSIEELVDIIEENGMIMEVGNYVMEQSMHSLARFLRHRKDNNENFYLSMNASPIQIAQKDFGKNTIETFSHFDFQPENISLEVTESALVYDAKTVRDNLFAIRDAGFNLSIDDFGTGYSSLSYLEKYPFTHLKIDKSFIEHIPSIPRKTRLLSSIVDISKAFDMKVVAEGIENEKQHEFLKQIGCDLGQGYLYGRPQDQNDFEKHFLKRQAA